ncbi:MAG: hydrogen peroxide-inducible genes activator [Dysgonamonadaceae bacterium]|jgi:LysR family hydrogen peroxide-inducible transcriptional activator|nr:hydrogen peroxide-inducible genes activator [Dysgonamonadaceae bacterium]
MNIQQLEYIVAVDNYRHFEKAAEACFITQPTLSAMIKKLEQELDLKIFDRSMHPIRPTSAGNLIIEQARIALRNFRQIKEISENERNMIQGEFKLGIIPTIAPYVVPELLHKQDIDGLDLSLIISESTTDNLIINLLNGNVDGGLMAGPLNHPKLVEYPIYFEQFYAYVSPLDVMYKEKEIDLDSVDINTIWLLENIHCLRGQIEQLCHIKRKKNNAASVKYEAGSIETLINVVEQNAGITIIPEMSAMSLNEEKQDNLRSFKNLDAYREVSLVVSKEYMRKAMLNRVLEMIKAVVPVAMQNDERKRYVVDVKL